MSDQITADFIQPEDQYLTEESVLNIGNEDEETKTPEESPTENKGEEEPDSSSEEETTTQPEKDEDIPFHKHPRWVERERKWQEEKERLERELITIKEMVEKPPAREETKSVDIPDWFGGDEVAWNKFQAYQEQERQRVKQELIAEQQLAVKRQQEAEDRWKKYTEDSLSRLELEGKDFDRNELMDVMLKWRPTDDSGNFDFSKGYEILMLQKAQNPSSEKIKARKKIADISTSKPSGSDNSSRDYATSDDFRGRSIYDLVRD